MTLEEQRAIIEMGRNAEALRENPALEACFASTLDDLFLKWASTEAGDIDERDFLWSTAQALQAFKVTVDIFIQEGAVERRNRDEDSK
jgi:hypothetical protein